MGNKEQEDIQKRDIQIQYLVIAGLLLLGVASFVWIAVSFSSKPEPMCTVYSCTWRTGDKEFTFREVHPDKLDYCYKSMSSGNVSLKPVPEEFINRSVPCSTLIWWEGSENACESERCTVG